MLDAPTTGAILAGGDARRMGGIAKGLVQVDGRRILDRVVDALDAALDPRCPAPRLRVIANAEGAVDWRSDVPVVHDLLPGRAALIGVHTALSHAPGAVLIAAWDMPSLSSDLLRHLRTIGERDGASMVVPWSPGPRGFEPLCAWYAPGCHSTIEAACKRGDYRFDDLMRALVGVVVPEQTVRSFGDPAILFRNVNRPEDL